MALRGQSDSNRQHRGWWTRSPREEHARGITPESATASAPAEPRARTEALRTRALDVRRRGHLSFKGKSGRRSCRRRVPDRRILPSREASLNARRLVAAVVVVSSIVLVARVRADEPPFRTAPETPFLIEHIALDLDVDVA